ncbi:hypothetical protein TNCV_2616141 [Trichonephila clavipes]|nr:hypothetical protein TNCV_2616141 [Trichonephila clavipes]
MAAAVKREARSMNGQSAFNREEILYVTTKDWAVHQLQTLRRMGEGLMRLFFNMFFGFFGARINGDSYPTKSKN